MFEEFIIVGIAIVVFVLAFGLKVIRPNEVASIEHLGQYKGIRRQGITLIIPFIQSIHRVSIAETLVDIPPQEVITQDNLNCKIDAQIYYKVKEDDASVYKALYKAENAENQIVNLAKTTLRNVIGNLDFQEANSKRDRINQSLMNTLKKEADSWGMDIVRTEIAQVSPPQDVQETMNQILKANNEKTAAKDFAEADRTKASGSRMADIERAEGRKRAAILEAEGQAEAIQKVAAANAKRIQLVNDAANKYFVGNAQILRKLEATEKSLKHGTKFIIPQDAQLVNVLSDTAGVTPLPGPKTQRGRKKQ